MYIRFNETALMVLTTAKEEANDFGVKAVGTEHLLLAMLSMNNTLSCKLLINMVFIMMILEKML